MFSTNPNRRIKNGFRSSPTAYRHGIRINVRTVAKESPQTTEIAMGERNLAWPVEKKARGMRPPTVVTVVSRTGLSRTMPEVTMACSVGTPSLLARFVKSTRINESFTTTPIRAIKPIMERKLKGSPMIKWPMTTPSRAKGMAAMTMRGWRKDLKSDPRMK